MQLLNLGQEHWDTMHQHVESCLPLEGCGLLVGQDDAVSEVIPIPNELQSPTGFRMNPADQIRAFNHIETSGMELIGIFHSHPALLGTMHPGPEGPSPTDIAEAAYPVVHVIWSRISGRWQARGFRIDDGRVSAVELRVAHNK